MEQEIGSWDSVLLENLSEESFINNLHQRYKRDLIYVSTILPRVVVVVVLAFRPVLSCIFVGDYPLGLICVLLVLSRVADVHRDIFGGAEPVQAVDHLHAGSGAQVCQQEPVPAAASYVSIYMVAAIIGLFFFLEEHRIFFANPFLRKSVQES